MTLALNTNTESQTEHTRIAIKNPLLWSIETPHLYHAKISIVEDSGVRDVSSYSFGIRTISFSATEGFQLNGEPLLLKGAALHHDNGFLGSAAIEAAEYRRVRLMKENGYNAIRCSHNPPSEVFLNACDQLGILVINEFTDMWDTYKNPDDYSRLFEAHWEEDISAMIKRDQNHPSIIMWSIGNEIPKMSVQAGVAISRKMVAKVKALDTTRPTTEALTNFLVHGGWENSAPYFEILDVAGYNYMKSAYESDHEKYPDRIMYASESYPNEPYEYWEAVEDLPYVIGDFVWSGMDYLGEASVAQSTYVKEKSNLNIKGLTSIPEGTDPTRFFDYVATFPSKWPSYISWCGDLDITGVKKPQGRYRDVLWDESLIEINVHEPIPEGSVEEVSWWGWPREWSTWNWQGFEGIPLQIRVFTKFPNVKIRLNGKTVGEKSISPEDRNTAVFEVPFHPGELTAIAFDGEGHEIQKTLTTTSKAVAVKLISETLAVRADRNELVFVKIELIDEDGGVVDNADTKVSIQVSGEGELAACGNADPTDMASVNNSTLNTYRGKAQLILRPFAQEGIIRVQVTSHGLQADELCIEVR